MKKTCKILSGSLLVALMAFGLVKGNPVEKTGGLQVRDVLAEDVTKDVAGRIVRKADGEAPVATGKVSEVKAQVSEEVEGKRHIRFVAAIDSYAYDAGYFDVTFKNGEEVVKTWEDQRVSYVYEAIEVEGKAKTPADLFTENAEEYASFEGCNYFIAFTVNNVPQAYWETTIEVSASVTSGETVYEKVAEKTVQEVIDADNPVPSVVEFVPAAAYDNPNEYHLQIEYPKSIFASQFETSAIVSISGTNSSGDISLNTLETGWVNGNVYSRHYGYGDSFNNDCEISVTISYNNVTYKSTFSMSKGELLTLTGYQTSAISTLDKYLTSKGYTENLYSTENWAIIQSLLEEGKVNINAATSFDEVDNALANACAAIDAVEQRDLGLDEVITNAKTSLTSHVNSKDSADYTEENWATIQSLLTEGLAAIEACESETDVTSTLDSYKNQIDAIEGIAIPLTFGNNWNPHGTYYLIFGWTNANVNSATIDQKSISIVLTTEDGTYTGQFICFDGAIHMKVFFQNLPSDIAKTSFTLTVEFTANGDSYAGTLSFDGTNKPY